MTGGADGVASSTTVGGQRGRRWGLSHSASANELLVLGPAAVAVRERPDRADAAIVVRSSDHDDTGVGGQRDRRCRLSHSTGNDQLLV